MRKIFIFLFSFIILLGGLKNQKSKYNNKEKLKIIKEDQSYPIKPINIIFMMPLFFSSSEMNQENKKFSDHALSFYLGAKTAIDFIFLFKKQKINIKIFDTKNEKKRIINFIHSYDLSKTHAIIGPFFRSSLEEVAKNNKKIPIISPFLSSDYLNFYPNIVQAEAKDIYLIEPILEEIKIIHQRKKIKTLYLLGEDTSKKITNFVKKKLLQWNLHFQVFYLEKNFPHVPTKKMPFFAVFLGGNSLLGEKFIEFIKEFPDKKIIPFGIGYNNIYYKNISLLREYKFLFTTKYHFNENDENKRKMFLFIKKKLGNRLNKYQLLGFDLSYDISSRLLEKKNLFEIIDKKPFSGLVSKYKYERISDKGGYLNKGLWIIRLH
ncbi:type 1 periplasmic-binding domain-containing protein [Blattabacterium cuenoti]|uniref:hypothetical protein n=1 Tax=Blattabacterium cuenoti TaxID=1653831 RepID=UPI00163D0318|nr:hypothetical protein [Blattabacterium cuenoti]